MDYGLFSILYLRRFAKKKYHFACFFSVFCVATGAEYACMRPLPRFEDEKSLRNLVYSFPQSALKVMHKAFGIQPKKIDKHIYLNVKLEKDHFLMDQTFMFALNSENNGII